MSDLVSVVIPTFRRCEMLARAIRSALSQTYGNIEIVVVDDNGSGSCNSEYVANVVDSFSDARVRLIQNAQNVGGAGARNVGIEESKGHFIAFLDDDDEYLPKKIECSLRRFKEVKSDKLALVYGFATSVYEDGSTFLNNGVYEGWCPAELLETRCLAATSQWVCDRKALCEVGGFERVPAKQDSILMLKLFGAGYEIACVQESLSLYYEHSGDRISGTSKTIEGEKILQKMGESFFDCFDTKTVKRVQYGYNARLAVLHYANGDYRKGFEHFRFAVGRRVGRPGKDIILPVLRIMKSQMKTLLARGRTEV